ncbi:MAG: hypothetical protein Q9223_000215 [Gallowayella weberi]
MSLLGRLPIPIEASGPIYTWPYQDSIERMVAWLVGLQTSVLQEEDLTDSTSTEAIAQVDLNSEAPQTPVEAAQAVSPEDPLADSFGAEPLEDETQWAGLTGRCNKVADTCYTFWAGGSLTILNSLHLLDQEALRRYLLEKTQHRIGGFGKLPGDVPGRSKQPLSCIHITLLAKIAADIMHSCLGLAGLAGMGEADLEPYDPSLCLSLKAKQRLESLPWRQRREYY